MNDIERLNHALRKELVRFVADKLSSPAPDAKTVRRIEKKIALRTSKLLCPHTCATRRIYSYGKKGIPTYVIHCTDCKTQIRTLL